MPLNDHNSIELVPTTTKVPAPFVVVALATAFPQIKPAKINLSLIGRF